jgi:hypothetical protein
MECVELNLSELHQAHQDGRLATVAWLSRNLLELTIWSEHCAASKENAKEFLLDSARDALDSLDLPDAILHNNLHRTRETLLANAGAGGFDIEQDYTKVAKVAKALGRGDVFRGFNKAFSKYAHPTALAIFSEGTDAQEQLRHTFYNAGVNLASSALRIINEAGQRIWAEIQKTPLDPS